MDRKQILLLALLGISIAFLIAGIVMLAVGIHKANSSGSCDAPATVAPVNPQTCAPHPSPPDYTTLSALFASSHHKITWDNSLNDPTSAGFKDASKTVSDQITTALGAALFGDTSNIPVKVTVNKFTQDAVSGVEAYSTLFYPNAVSDDAVKAIQNTLSKAGYNNALFNSPITQCNGQPIAPPNSNPVGPTSAPTTPPAPSLAPGVVCDASSNLEAIVFLIDIAVPAYGSYGDKLSAIRQLLSNIDILANLDQAKTWTQEVFFIPYYGNDAYTLESSPCRNHACWMDAVSSLNESLNYNQVDSHNLARGLQYVSESLGTQLKSGIARNLIVITDGIDFRFSSSIAGYGNYLKTTDLYTISAISVTSSPTVTSILQGITTDASHFYSIPDFTWISNTAIKSSSAQWICQAYYPTQPPVTPAKTAAPLKTTTLPLTTSGITLPPTTTPYANCLQDIVFMIDESQTMLDNAFSNALTFASQLSAKLSALHADSKFAIVTFNSKLVFTSGDFLTADILAKKIPTIPMISGVADYTVGFTEARKLIRDKSRFGTAGVRPLVIFITDGDIGNNNLPATELLTLELRQNYRTEIIALGINPLPSSVDALKKAIGVGALDSYTPAVYNSVKDGNDLVNTGEDFIVQNIHCEDKPVAVSCGMDLTFVIETSYALANDIDIEKRVIANTIQNFKDVIGPFKGKMSVVYFSTPNNTAPEGGRSGILFQQLDDIVTADNILAAKNFVLGGLSDIKTGLQLATNVVSSDMYGNDQYVVVFTRGKYIDGNATNCCDDPAPAAAALRAKASVQGVVIGVPPEKAELDSLTGVPSIDGNALIKAGDAAGSAKAISDKLTPLIKQHMSKIQCKPLPAFLAPCVDYIDVTIAWHGSNNATFNGIRDFVAQTLLPGLFGGELSARQVTRNTPINIALATIDDNHVNILNDFENLASPAAYSQIAASAVGGSGNTPLFSKLYNAVGDLKKRGRDFASDIILIITDSVALSDEVSAMNALNALSPAYANGIVIGAQNLIVSGNPTIISTVDQLNSQNTRSSRTLANVLIQSACTVVTTPAPQTIPTTTARTTPYPIPIEKPRDVWPDITILVDTTFDNGKGMTDRGFQVMREFVTKFFLKNMYVGDQFSRIALATFGEHTNIACTYGEIHDHFDFRRCLSYFVYDIVSPHHEIRDLGDALKTLKATVFDRTFGDYIPLKENFLLIFTTGAPSFDVTEALHDLRRMGITTVGFDLGQHMTSTELSVYGIDSVSIPNWMDENSGIIGNNNFGYALVDKLTSKHRQPLSKYFADFYFIVDESLAMNGSFSAVRTFLHNFVSQLTLSPHRTRVAIVPYASDVLSSKLLLTDNRTAFENYFNTQFQYQVPGNADANIGAAITLVNQYIHSNPKPLDRENYVVYITAATTVFGDAKGVYFTNDTSNITPLVLQTNPKISYSGSLAPGQNVFALRNVDNLNNWVYTLKPHNNMTNFFSRLGETQEDYRESHSLTLDEVNIDFAFAVDLTGLNNQTYEHVKNYLIDFVKQFHVGYHGSQFALQAFNGRMMIGEGFHFSDCTDLDAALARIRALKYEAANDGSTDADLITALIQIRKNFLIPQNGWRNGPTYVIMLTSGKTFYEDMATTNEALKIEAMAKTSMIQLNGISNSGFVQQFANDQYLTVDKPEALTVGSFQNQIMQSSMLRYVANLLFPPQPNLPDVYADFYFLIDHNNRLNATEYRKMKKWLKNFVIVMNNMFYTEGRMAVIGYDSYGYEPRNTFGFDSWSDVNELNELIDELQYQEYATGNSDLESALQFAYKNRQLGYDPYRCTFYINIAVSPDIPKKLDDQFLRQFNKEVFTYSYVYGSSTPYDYVTEFLGADGQDHYVENADFSTFEKPFKQYIIDSYASFKATHPQK